jgi:natural product biosynthesis luciferase-like monooxygenase protein
MSDEVFVFPTSFAQQRLWFLEQLNPGTATYNLAEEVMFHGPCNIAALDQTLTDMIGRHEVLRTTLATDEGNPVQVVSPAARAFLPVIDLSALPADQKRAEWQRLAGEEARRPFDLMRGPLFRTHLIRLATFSHVLLLTIHHIISDARSQEIFSREFQLLYEAYSLGKPVQLPELTIQYADFAVWQHEWMQGEVLKTGLDYWRKQLEGIRVLQLPTDRPRPSMQTSRGARHKFSLSEAVSEGLRKLSRRCGVTLYMTLLAAFQILLARYSGQEDISVGTPIAGRNRVEMEGLIGFFVNQLVMRTRLNGDPTFVEVLERVREVALEAYTHQDVPFEKLVEELQPERDLSRSPLFQVMFALQNVSAQSALTQQRAANTTQTSIGTARFDLMLSMTDSRQINGSVEYNTDLFESATIERLFEHFKQLLGGLQENADRRIWHVPLLSEAERGRLLVEWNETRRAFPHHLCIHDFFEAQVARTHARIAVVFEDESLTYFELNERAEKLAHQLRLMNVGPEVLVGICAERSVEMVVGLLAILKAGGAYLPLDPLYPPDRLAFMIEDASVSVLLTQRHLQDRLPEHGVRVVHLDSEWPGAFEVATEGSGEVAPENLAYVIYTSGSTGKPKGVMIAHRNVVNFFTAMDEALGHDAKSEGPPGVWLALTSISFDISVLELLWTLTRGFEVIIQPEQISLATRAVGAPQVTDRRMDFSLFYFANDGAREAVTERYRLLIDGARFADENGFQAVWTPERHFHPFGDLYPNPAITSAALATITKRIQIRAGSLVLPLHHPVRVAEEWAMVDNLSAGRVGISFASGWHAADFIFAPENYAGRKQIMLEQIEVVRKLWRGESLSLRGGSGTEVSVRALPTPVQKELPVWLTAAGHPDTFRAAGQIGANMLTHLLGQGQQELAEKIAIYREAWQLSGHKGRGHVSLMLHTFVGPDPEVVREKVRVPFTNYLASSLDLMKNLAQSLGLKIDSSQFTEDDWQALFAHAFNRYFETSGLFGTPEQCIEIVESLKKIDVDEVACLIDFGVDYASVMESLKHLDEVRRRSNSLRSSAVAMKGEKDYSLAAQMLRYRVTHMQCTPSLASMLLMDIETRDALSSLSKLMIGGEALSTSLASLLKQVVRGEVRNMYGPTETTIWSTVHPVRAHEITVPIGRPIANTSIYILDQHLEPTPVGVAGEIHIGGAGVARGYLNRQDLSAARFIPDPFGGEPGARLYTTGDLGRYRPDGTIEILGRLDEQLKLRGHRVEPGEIERVLAEHERVREAIVMARADESEDARLVAYLVCHEGPPVTVEELRQHLQERLPPYMIPQGWVMLEELPLTPNGKVDRKALPLEDEARAGGQQADTFVEARTPVEKALVSIWSDGLRARRVGIHDNFFKLGGHSLLATRLIAQVRQQFQMDVPLRYLFESPTVAAFALRIEESQRQASLVDDRKISLMLDRLETLSDEEVRQMLAAKAGHAHNI